ncbi:MAG: Flp family type IVb pilin [Lentisphaeria bacterium]|nr:Flp family type IVb pilin [Lentisphaeria bacterium]
MRTLRRRRQKGQAFVEYVILVAVIALATLFVLANFSDRLKAMITGITETLGGEPDASAEKKSVEIIQELGN